MPYIPHLIPEEHRVLQEYFNTKNPQNKPGQKPPSPFWWIAVVLFALATIGGIDRPWMAALTALTALLCTPLGKRSLENTFRFHLSAKLRLLLFLFLILLYAPLSWYYRQAEDRAAIEIETLHRQAAQFTADSLKKDQLREDSLQQQIKQSRNQPLKTAWNSLVNAGHLTKTTKDKDTLTQARHLIALRLSTQLIGEGRYDHAQAILAEQFKLEPGSPSLLYYRALCYYRAGNVKQAISALDSAQNNGYKEAQKMYNKINPLKKRVAYYCTLCCDGSTSDASGRGACSWHGGVCDWHHPVYETYRKYPSSHDTL